MTSARTTSAVDMQTSVADFEELHKNPSLEGWQSKWSRACRAFWTALITDPATAESSIRLFISLLQDPSRFALARLVISEMRQVDIPNSVNAQQRTVLEQVKGMRERTVEGERIDQRQFDDAGLRREKQIMHDIQMHRARVFLHDSGAFGSENEKEIKEWLEQAPRLHDRPASGEGSQADEA